MTDANAYPPSLPHHTRQLRIIPAMLHRNLLLLATLASAFLILPPQAAHASDFPNSVTIGEFLL